MLDGANGLLFDQTCLLFDDIESIHAYHVVGVTGQNSWKIGFELLGMLPKAGRVRGSK